MKKNCKAKHKIVATMFVILMMPIMLIGVVIGLVWRGISVGIKIVEKFIEWI